MLPGASEKTLWKQLANHKEAQPRPAVSSAPLWAYNLPHRHRSRCTAEDTRSRDDKPGHSRNDGPVVADETTVQVLRSSLSDSAPAATWEEKAKLMAAG